MLGHANLQTTEIYTHVSIDKLIAAHRATHSSRLQRQRDREHPVTGPSLDEARDTLLNAMEAEGNDDAVDAEGVAADAETARRKRAMVIGPPITALATTPQAPRRAATAAPWPASFSRYGFV